MNHLKSIAIVASSVLFLAACSSTPAVKSEDKSAVVQPTASQAPTPVSKPAVPSAIPMAVTPLAPYLDPANPLYSKRSVYFDYDNFAIKPEFTPMLEIHGKYLASHPNVSIRVEGNTDERGSSEYNLALGQKRADSVVRALKLYQVKEAQMEAISWGAEKPRAPGHDELSLSQNRRVDLGYPKK